MDYIREVAGMIEGESVNTTLIHKLEQKLSLAYAEKWRDVKGKYAAGNLD